MKSDIIKVEDIEFNGKQEEPVGVTENPLIFPSDLITFERTVYIPGIDAASFALYPLFYVATVDCYLMEAKLRHATNGGSGATVDIRKLTSGTSKANNGGTSMISGVFDISANANTTLRKKPNTTTTKYSKKCRIK